MLQQTKISISGEIWSICEVSEVFQVKRTITVTPNLRITPINTQESNQTKVQGLESSDKML